MQKHERRVIQIIPADGWFSYYHEGKNKAGVETYSRSKVLCLALFDDGEIAFMDTDGGGWIEIAAETSNFAHVRYEGEDA